VDLSEKIVDGHYFNLIRGNARDPGLKDFTKEQLRKLYPEIADIRRATRTADQRPQSPDSLAEAYGLCGDAHVPPSDAIREPGGTEPLEHAVYRRGNVRGYRLRRPGSSLRAARAGRGFEETGYAVQGFLGISREEGRNAKDPVRSVLVHARLFHHDSLRYSYKTMLLEVPRNYFSRKVW
jgi:hypothetical protein